MRETSDRPLRTSDQLVEVAGCLDLLARATMDPSPHMLRAFADQIRTLAKSVRAGERALEELAADAEEQAAMAERARD